ncbi:hypothetical protein B0H10DRAFT_1964962 [Mycena sp. CBHHK59/15]|nr:hypothetical protein B0H10DRAFT_1964962 [Mycena sp. CBHHK59/15]
MTALSQATARCHPLLPMQLPCHPVHQSPRTLSQEAIALDKQLLTINFDCVQCYIFSTSKAALHPMFPMLLLLFGDSVSHAIPGTIVASSGGVTSSVTSPIESSLESSDDVDTLPHPPSALAKWRSVPFTPGDLGGNIGRMNNLDATGDVGIGDGSACVAGSRFVDNLDHLSDPVLVPVLLMVARRLFVEDNVKGYQWRRCDGDCGSTGCRVVFASKVVFVL